MRILSPRTVSKSPTADPIALSRSGATLAGPTPSDDLPRLAAVLADEAGSLLIDWQAQFVPAGQTSHGHPALQLSCQADLAVPCIRCLAGVTIPVRIEQHYCLVRDEDRAAAMDQEVSEYDVVAVTGEWSLLDLIEDELLLALPLMPRHENCEPHAALASDEATDVQDAPNGTTPDRQFPFADLARQMKKSGH